MKRLLVLLMALAVVLMGIPAFAAETAGECGVNLTWSFDEQTGRLTISGNGIMKDYYYDQKPWDHFSQQATELVIEPGVLGIGENAFYGMEKIAHVSLPEGLVSIDNYAFANCGALTELRIPDTVWAMGVGIVKDCVSLTAIKLPKGILHIPDVMFSGCQSLVEYQIPDTVTSIGGGAFAGTGLTHITIPGNVKTVDYGAFQNCIYLESIDIQEGVQILGTRVFENCAQLKQIEFPASLQGMTMTLRDNNSLEKITFRGHVPVGCNYIDNDLPEHKKVTIYYPRNVKTWTDEVVNGFSDNFTLVGYDVEIIPDTILATGTCDDGISWTLNDDYVLTVSGTGRISNLAGDCWLGYNEWIKKVVVVEGITELGDSSFRGFVNLEEVELSNSVTVIARGAFEHCDRLTYVKIPASVESIATHAFYSCDILERVDIMGSRTEFSMSAFFECPKLKEVNMLGTEPPAQPDPTQPSETVGSETKPSSAEQKPQHNSDQNNDHSMAVFVSIVVSLAILAAGGAVSAVLIIRKRRA